MATLVPIARAPQDALLHLVNACWTADGIPHALAPEEIADFTRGPHLDPEVDGRVVVEDGEPVAYGIVHCRPTDQKDAWARLTGSVHPDARRSGIGSALLGWQIDRARERLAYAEGRLDRVIRVEVHPGERSKASMLRHHGFEPVRYFDEMIRPLDTLPRVESSGFEIIPWDPHRSEETRNVKNAAFRDHWGSTPVDKPTWHQWLEDFGTRLDLSFMAVAGGAVVGYTLNGSYPQDEAIRGRREGWIENLGTLAEWRGRGVATALVCASLEAFSGAGLTHAALGVDADSPTGARGLYTRLGFEIDYQMHLAQRAL
jgi:ribosomal protein S18 acetylase RimI-like enzyme